MTKSRIALLIGGPSNEHAISRASATAMMTAIDPKYYDLSPVLITPQLQWRVYSSSLGLDADTPKFVADQAEMLRQMPYMFDAALLALHGEYGEDGTIQRLLDRAGMPYQGSGPRASQLAFNKAAASQLLRRLGVTIPDYVFMNRAEWVATRGRKLRQLIAALGHDLVVKPNAAGSSVGVFIVHTPAQLADAIEQVSVSFDSFIVQRYIAGQEVTCAVIETSNGLVPMPPTLIRPKTGKFFDYASKYKAGATEEITPAPFPPAAISVIQQTALRVHRALGCQDYSRTDMIIGRGRVWVLELNSLPGMTDTSLLPQAAAAYGWSFSDLMHHLIACAIQRPEVIELH